MVIKYLVQLKFIYYHSSENKNIYKGLCKFEIIGKLKIFCVSVSGQDFGNFEELLWQYMLFDTKTWICYWKGVFVPMFGQ